MEIKKGEIKMKTKAEIEEKIFILTKSLENNVKILKEETLSSSMNSSLINQNE